MNSVNTLVRGTIASLDEMLDGIPCGHITEITGKPTYGMSTLAYYLMASAQSANQHVVFVDMGSSFHGEYAVGIVKLLLQSLRWQL